MRDGVAVMHFVVTFKRHLPRTGSGTGSPDIASAPEGLFLQGLLLAFA